MVDDVRNCHSIKFATMLLRWTLSGVAAIVVLSPQLVVWKLLYGSWYNVPQGAGFMRWDDIAWTETLFSSRNGLFAWAPLYAPMLIGLVVVRPEWRLVGPLLTGVLLQAVVNGAVWDWWGGGSFGGRRFDSTFIVFALGATALLSVVQRIVVATLQRRTRRQIALALFAGAISCLGIISLVAQLIVVGHTSVVSARKQGGQSAATIFAEKAGPAGAVSGALSDLATFPMRLLFAYRNDVDLHAYDKLVGVHYLGETFPGLNSEADKVVETISVAKLRPPHCEGLATDGSGSAVITADQARIFVGLNRRDDVIASIVITTSGNIKLQWDNDPSITKNIAGTETVSIRASQPSRGVHWLKIRAPLGSTVHSLTLQSE